MPLDFQPILLEGQDEYRQRLRLMPQVSSDYSFVHLWSWRDEHQLEWAWTEDLVWIRQKYPSQMFWAPVGPWESLDWKRVFQDPAWQSVQFTRIPETLAALWDKTFSGNSGLESNRDDWDYLYSVQELIELKGNRFHRKKNLLRQFIRKYDYAYWPLTEERVEKALTLQTEWCLWRDCEDSTTLEAENRAILKVLSSWQDLKGVFGAGLAVDGNMVAFTIAEPLLESTVLIHFEKGCPAHKGVYQAINQLFLANSASHFTTVNREQDIGDSGLRKAKESYNPSSYLKKYKGPLCSKNT